MFFISVIFKLFAINSTLADIVSNIDWLAPKPIASDWFNFSNILSIRVFISVFKILLVLDCFSIDFSALAFVLNPVSASDSSTSASCLFASVVAFCSVSSWISAWRSDAFSTLS